MASITASPSGNLAKDIHTIAWDPCDMDVCDYCQAPTLGHDLLIDDATDIALCIDCA